jgi:hypothetical protein
MAGLMLGLGAANVACTEMLQGRANAVATAPIAAACDLPRLDFSETDLAARDQARFAEQFGTAFARACRDGLFAEKPLVDQRSEDKRTIVVLHSPVAKGTAIYYAPSGAPPAMLLESPVESSRKIPSADEFYAAMQCAVRWPTADEQEQDGRCLAD